MKTNLIRALAGFVFISAFVGVPAHADDPQVLVVGDTVIDDGTHVWTTPVVVAPGSSLTIKNATVYLDYLNSCTPRSNVTVCTTNLMVNGGTLRIENSTIDSHLWSGDDFASGYDIQGWGATYEVKNSTLQHYSSFGTQGPGGGRSSITGSSFRWGMTAVWFWRGAQADITGNTFTDDYHAVEIRDTSAVISGNHFNRSDRVVGDTIAGRALDLEATILGEKYFVTDPLVENNIIENGSLGILNLNAFPNVLRNNVIRNNTVGAQIGMIAGDETLNAAVPVFAGNVLDGNVTALMTYVSGAPRNGVAERDLPLHGNSFVNTVCADIDAAQVPANDVLKVDATGNWWGSAAGPQDRVVDEEPCPALVGSDINVDPWLTSAP